jgi:hypothetical protein
MKQCPYCGYSNYDSATACRKCDSPLVPVHGTIYSTRQRVSGPQRSRSFRNLALCAIVLGLMIQVYWGGYGPWPTIDNPRLVSIRSWLQPLLLYGGAAAYVLGWILRLF